MQSFIVLLHYCFQARAICLVQKDLQDLDIKLDETTIRDYSKTQWKILVWNVIKKDVFQKLISANLSLENTKDIIFTELRMSDYLIDSRNTTLSKIIFSLLSKTFDIKTWQPWKYFDNLCVLCEIKEETMDHFLSCKTYENIPQELDWKDIKGSCVERQFEIAVIVRARQKKRKETIESYEAGHPPT